MELSKKGMFFTLTVITLLFFFVASYGVYSFAEKQSSINKRITTMNNHVLSIESDLSRKLYISGFRIIFLLEEKISNEGEYISDIDGLFNEGFFNGTLENEEKEILTSIKFSDIESELNEKAKKINLNLTMSNTQIYVYQEDPWNVKFTMQTDFLVTDLGNLAKWNKTLNISAEIPIDNFEDPLYIISTNGIVSNKINQTIYTTFIDGSDTTNLTDHIENSYYINSTLAPSFLDRLSGDLSANPNGIESLVNLQKLSSQGLYAQNKSIVDYIYFSNNNPESSHISNTPSWVIIDTEHLSIYD